MTKLMTKVRGIPTEIDSEIARQTNMVGILNNVLDTMEQFIVDVNAPREVGLIPEGFGVSNLKIVVDDDATMKPDIPCDTWLTIGIPEVMLDDLEQVTYHVAYCLSVMMLYRWCSDGTIGEGQRAAWYHAHKVSGLPGDSDEFADTKAGPLLAFLEGKG